MRIFLKYIAIMFLFTSCAMQPKVVTVGGEDYLDKPLKVGFFVWHRYTKDVSTWEQFILDAKGPIETIQWVALIAGALAIAAAVVIGSPRIVKLAKRVGVAAAAIWGASLIAMLALDFLWLLLIPLGIALLIFILHKTTDFSLLGSMKKKIEEIKNVNNIKNSIDKLKK